MPNNMTYLDKLSMYIWKKVCMYILLFLDWVFYRSQFSWYCCTNRLYLYWFCIYLFYQLLTKALEISSYHCGFVYFSLQYCQLLLYVFWSSDIAFVVDGTYLGVLKICSNKLYLLIGVFRFKVIVDKLGLRFILSLFFISPICSSLFPLLLTPLGLFFIPFFLFCWLISYNCCFRGCFRVYITYLYRILLWSRRIPLHIKHEKLKSAFISPSQPLLLSTYVLLFHFKAHNNGYNSNRSHLFWILRKISYASTCVVPVFGAVRACV